MIKKDNVLFNRLVPKYISINKFNKIVLKNDIQIVQIESPEIWKFNHILFSINFSPDTFEKEFLKKLDKNKKIILFGNFHSMAKYYRILKFNGYRVFLIK